MPLMRSGAPGGGGRRRGSFRPGGFEREPIEPFAIGVDQSFLLARVQPQHAESGGRAESGRAVGTTKQQQSAQRLAQQEPTVHA